MDFFIEKLSDKAAKELVGKKFSKEFEYRIVMDPQGIYVNSKNIETGEESTIVVDDSPLEESYKEILNDIKDEEHSKYLKLHYVGIPELITLFVIIFSIVFCVVIIS